MYTPLDTVHILFETFLVCFKMRELFEVAELGRTPCMMVYVSVIVLTERKAIEHFRAEKCVLYQQHNGHPRNSDALIPNFDI
jgi:hypothetical protein